VAFQCIIYEKKDAIGYLTLNRPERLNALNATLLAEFREVMEVVEADPDVRAVILTGAGRAFSAGFDINREPGDSDPQELQPDQWRTQLKSHIDTFMMVWNLSKPVIAAVNGYALAGACELVQICDIKIASDRAVMGEPEIRAGVGPPLLITPFSVNLATAKELLLTGDTIDAQEAARIGLVSRVVPHDDLLQECERIARKITLISEVGVKMTKIAVNRALEGMGFLTAIQHNLELMTHFDTSATPEQTEFNSIRQERGLRAALDWRDARFRELQ
jgi:enoyl-CoA hydratase